MEKDIFKEGLKRCFKHNKMLFAISIIIFFSGFLVGSVITYWGDASASFEYEETHPEYPLNQFTNLEITSLLIKHNGIEVLALISGSFFLGLITLFNLFVNGITIGVVIMASTQKGLSPTTLSLLILPHGVFELSALFIAGAAGFKMPYELIRYLGNKKDYILNREEIKDFLILSGVSMVLIVIAGIVEANITLSLAEKICI